MLSIRIILENWHKGSILQNLPHLKEQKFSNYDAVYKTAMKPLKPQTDSPESLYQYEGLVATGNYILFNLLFLPVFNKNRQLKMS